MSRIPGRSYVIGRMSRAARGRVLCASVMATALAASMLSVTPAQAEPAEPAHLVGQVDKLDKHGRAVRGVAWKPKTPPHAKLPAPVWPAAGTAISTAAASAGRVTAAERGRPTGVTAKVVDRKALPQRWRAGVVARVSAQSAGTTAVTMDYSKFRSAYGGGWSSRLRLWSLPDCALTTPDNLGCTATPLASRNNTATRTVTADVAVTASTLVALAAAPSGDSGDFTATPLSASSSWSAGGSTGAFSWSYPMRTPPSINGASPGVAVSYSSAGADGRSSASNNQPSWIGEGFEYAPGFIERRYVPCTDDKSGTQNAPTMTGDLCWRTDNAVLSLAGASTELVYEQGKGWHSRSEDGSQIVRLTGATNGDNDGEHWKVTTTDGTQFFFGRNNLPGQSSETKSTWTVPVYSNHAGEPGHDTTFADSRETQAWRWNLDYAVDARGNTTSYWYDKETNQYAAEATSSKTVSYVRGGTLARIDYGTWDRSSTDRSVTALGQVILETADRCNTNCATHDGNSWPDTPWDQECKSDATTCEDFSPTFWSTKRLAKVRTRIWDTTKTTPAWQDVDSYTLSHSFPSPGDGTQGGLWLDSIVHAGHVGGTTTMPPITFEPVAMLNRVQTKTNTTNNWQRLSNIYTETGARIQVIYSLAECTSSNLPTSPENNTKLCYPVIGQNPVDPDGPDITEWWHKYVVRQVLETDMQLADGHQSPTKNTYYTYGGTPAWHYADDDGLSKPSRKTWDQFRGYATVSTQVGDTNQTLTKTTYLRGMHGDRTAPSGGTRTVTVDASLGTETVYDEDQFAGMVREQTVYNGTEDKPVSKTVNVPWRSNPTASRTINGDTVTARYAGTKTTYQGTALGVDGARGWRVTSSQSTFDDAYGVATSVQDDGDTSKSGDEQCTMTSYNRNTTKNIVTLPKQVTVTTLTCGTAPTSPDHIISDTLTFYDAATSATTAPTLGNLTRTDVLKTWTAAAGTTWLTTATATFDGYGRRLTATDPVRGSTVRSDYTPANSLATKTVSTTTTTTTIPTSLAWTSTNEFHPAWAAPTKITDQNGRITEATYDPLGRTSQVWDQGWLRTQHPTQPSMTFTYGFSATRDSYPYVKTESLNAAGGTNVSYDIYDGLLRARQTQRAAVGGGRVVTDTLYDAYGRAELSYGAHTEPDAPTGTLWWEPEWSVPTQSLTLYDRAGRATTSMFRSGDGVTNIVEKWRTTTTYEGDRITVVPPKGATPSTTVTDALGRTAELRQYTTASGTGGAYDTTKYGYNGKNQLTAVTDPAGDQWTYKFDIRGRQIESVDPDKGKTVSVYNDAGDVTQTTDARNEVLAYTYDDLGRKTGVYDDAVDATKKRTEWKYDKLSTGSPIKGQLTEAIRYDNGNAYKWQARGFNLRYQLSGEHWVIPTSEIGLAGTYVYGHGYSAYTGAPTTLTYPAGGGQVTETVTTTYDTASGLPNGLQTNLPNITSYIVGQQYTGYGEPTVTTMKIGGGVFAEQSLAYELDTRRVSRFKVKPETATGTVVDRSYTYEDAGSPLSITDTPQVGAADTQCFTYDQLERLTSAWTPKSGVNCTTAPSTTNLGGPAPYWLDWTIDKLGNRTKEVSHTTTGDTTRTYAVPTPGLNVVRPHAVTAMTTTAPGQTTGTTTSYGYDDTGNMTTRPGATAAQTLTWDAEGKAVKVVEGTQTTTSLYDANGTRLIRRDAGGTTLYLPGMEVRRTVSGSTATLTGTRYYSFNSTTIASRTTGLTWLFNDHQGTQQIAVNANSQQVTIRRQQPYGNPRGTEPLWPNSKGFVGGDKDPTGLTHIGAREYDPLLGRFISVDPLQDLNDPQQWNAYSYSGNDPIGHSDPTGLRDDDHFYGTAGIGEILGEIAARVGGGSDNGGGGGGNGGGGGGSGSSSGNGGGSSAGSIYAASLKAQLDAGYDATIGAAQGIYSQFESTAHQASADGEAIARGDMTVWQALWGQAKRQFWNQGMPGGAWNMVKGLWDEAEAAVTADNATDATYHGTYFISTVALMFVGGKGIKPRPTSPRNALADGVKGNSPGRGPPLSCDSFTPGTLVLMADGSSKPIGDIRTGDQVLATDPVTDRTEKRPVVATHVNDDTEFTDVTIQVAGGAQGVIQTTQEHPIWDEGRQSWRDARDLEPGTRLHGADGKPAEVTATSSYEGRRFMYNLTIADIHTYYVIAGKTPVLVHNDNGGIDLSNATEVRGRFPVGGALDAGGPANGILYRTQNGQISNYAAYDADGVILRRVDLVGAAHGGVATPHVQEFTRNVAPDGRIFPQQSRIATPAGPGDLPRVGC